MLVASGVVVVVLLVVVFSVMASNDRRERREAFERALAEGGHTASSLWDDEDGKHQSTQLVNGCLVEFDEVSTADGRVAYEVDEVQTGSTRGRLGGEDELDSGVVGGRSAFRITRADLVTALRTANYPCFRDEQPATTSR
ncbi:hypothetical protein GCM10009634_58290 [Saccharothrix xinjiangensis]